MLTINLKQLEAFVTTAERCSFTRAAEELYLTQSTVSAHIAALERELGAQLIVRGARMRVTLTEEGKLIYGAAKDILTRCQALQDSAAAPVSDELNIAASTVPAQYLLPGLLSRFLKGHDGCRYLLRRGDSASVHAMLDRGEARIGFVGAALDRSGCTYHAVAEDTLVLITANSGRFQELQSAGTQGRELLAEPLLAREENSGTQMALERYLKDRGIARDRLRVVARMDNPETIKNSVAQGLGVSVISRLAVETELAAGKLLAFPLDREGIRRKIFVAWRRELALTGLEEAFIHSAREAARKTMI